MKLKTLQYTSQQPDLPVNDRHILAFYDESEILVYIPHLGEYFDDTTVSRPVWVTPSFSWMMHHTDWLQSEEYDSIECMKIQRSAFENMLSKCFPADFPNNSYGFEDEWKNERMEAKIQFRWQSDYSPDGQELNRQVLLLSIHSRTWMEHVIRDEIAPYSDIDKALFRQKEHTQHPYESLIVPDERVYLIDDNVKKVLEIID